MRQPLKKQNPPRSGRRYSAYQNRIFLYLVTLVTAPLLLLGVLSSVVYYRQTVTRSDAMLTSARENVEAQIEIALSSLRSYYSAMVNSDNYQTLHNLDAPPYSQYTLVRDMQNAMRGGSLVDKYVEGYTYINLRSGWVLSNNGMYRLADAANREEVAHLLGEWSEQHASMMWVNRTEFPTPARADTPLNTVDLTGELLVLRSSSYRTGSYAVLIVKLDLSPLYEMTESWQTGGYSIAARDFTGKTVLSTSAALTALLDANTPAEGACVQDGWRLNSGRMGVNGLTYYAALPQRTLAATAGTVILIAFALAGVLVAVLLICRRSTSVLYAPVDDLMHAASNVFGQPGSDEEEFAYLSAGVRQVAKDKQVMQSLMQQHCGKPDPQRGHRRSRRPHHAGAGACPLPCLPPDRAGAEHGARHLRPCAGNHAADRHTDPAHRAAAPLRVPARYAELYHAAGRGRRGGRSERRRPRGIYGGDAQCAHRTGC